MIVRVEMLQCLECDICGDVVEVRRETAENPETMLMMIEALEDEHRPCVEFPDDPERAQREREFRAQIKAELKAIEAQKACRKPRKRRKSGAKR